jgi:methylated-DNA-[protein]-cysteine S-methyltransferase
MRKSNIAIAETAVTHLFPSDLGWMALAWSGDRLTQFTFGHPSAAAASASLEADRWNPSESQSIPAWIADLASRLQSFAAGHDERFNDVQLDLTHLSAFQSRVVRACRRIPRGKVRSYGELAAVAGSPGAARAVGSVMAKNRFPIIVPCHRVVASGGALGGFTARDGVNMKRRMLELEGAIRTLLHKSPLQLQRLGNLHANGAGRSRRQDVPANANCLDLKKRQSTA